MKALKLKAVAICLLSIVTFGAVGANTALASNDNWGFHFSIQPHQANTRSGARYRQTTNVNNKWKVNMQSSGEGARTVTTYWLENAGGTNVSPSMNVKQGNGSYYSSAYSNASKKNVYLTAQNNNYNGSRYSVSGFWDEETN
ncbi:DUF2712 domain-containing protein [Lactiplantibacillus pentosus]|uniref:DUF2712 domain-containing protein n=1 Tax=Lactiplantibacillus pentosus TaxID=1589 RepID=A0AAW8W0S2_LACPE|nr:DUF2712 domain-containing protein [Lactiplantibacillus pentosus]AUI79007.1 hypothetical protein BB562_10070 [Lactiplantibacillus pentosus]MBO9164089.1 DUF2712 domain-containing protein [Lactiplantibacillus pentosus]MBQ0836726.1 DUF2712 domain-containing protein [Lactiplantibacillus pentosus]MBU7463868.1 DUF2712 domain-containing protein [Lactiplantibacillus pentosus]MBU7473004.1 DUF2712 domain-containing protein [Lactiplantibacillus pentosus]